MYTFAFNYFSNKLIVPHFIYFQTDQYHLKNWIQTQNNIGLKYEN